MISIVPVSWAIPFQNLANYFHHLYESLLVQFNGYSNNYFHIVRNSMNCLCSYSAKIENNQKINSELEKYEEYYEE